MTDVISAMDITATEQLQAMRIGEYLNKHYPGHLWAVRIYQGLVIIKNLKLSADDAFVLHQDKIDNDGKDIIRAGGEILERFKMRRAGINENDLRDLKHDFRGKIIHD